MRPIDADALKIHVCDMCDDGQRECKGDESCAILCWINDMPTIEPEVRYGRWIDKGEYAVCTECGGRSGTQYDGIQPIALATQFCPNCGARMSGGTEDAD